MENERTMENEPVVYPGPAEAPVITPVNQPWIIHRADIMRDWYALCALRLAAERRLRAMGIPQWTDTARGLDEMSFFTNRDDMYLIRQGPTAIGCFALTSWVDESVWSDPDRDECLYLNKVMVAPWMSGTGVGHFIVNHAMEQVRDRKCSALRLYSWYENTPLYQHWQNLGFTHVGTITVPNGNSGALMEMKFGQRPTLQPTEDE